MPLKKSPSKQAFKQNVETEMKSGKSQKQSLAIAYATRRAASNKYAKGGEVHPKLAEYMKHSDADAASQEAGDKVGKGLASIRHEHDTLEQARNAHARANPEAAKHYSEALGHYKRAEAAYKEYSKNKPKKMATGGEVESAPKADTIIPDKGYGRIIIKAAQGGMLDTDEANSEPMHGDPDNFLSAEDALETPFHSDTMSDADELAEAGQEVHPQMDNEEGNPTLEAIMQKIRRKNMGR